MHKWRCCASCVVFRSRKSSNACFRKNDTRSPAEAGPTMLLMIDNYDSFTWNLVQYLGELGEDVQVVRNDESSVDAIRALNPTRIVISPGPGTPDQAGICLALIERLGGHIPIMGVCLGLQSIGQAFGGKVVRAAQIMH